METKLRITKVTTYSIAKVVKLRPRHQSSTPVRRQLVYHDIDESTISGPRIPSMISLLSTDSLDNLDRVLANDLNPLQPKFEPKLETSITEQRKYSCKLCGAEFYHQMSKEAHVLSHTGTLPRKRKPKTPLQKLAKIAKIEERASTPFKKSLKKLRMSLRRKKSA